jgi:hypothetical protein
MYVGIPKWPNNIPNDHKVCIICTPKGENTPNDYTVCIICIPKGENTPNDHKVCIPKGEKNSK